MPHCVTVILNIDDVMDFFLLQQFKNIDGWLTTDIDISFPVGIF